MDNSLHELYMELYGKVMDDDIRSQRYYLSVIETQRHISVDYLLEQGVLFIPNNDYITHYLGDKAVRSRVGLYYQDRCQWTLFATIPIRDLSGTIMGLVGWDAYNKYKELEQDEKGLVAYRVSPSFVFPRERYFLSDVGCLERNFEKRVVFVTDGVFDSMALNFRGVPAIALLGSTFSKEILYFLSWYKYVYVCTDNDKAGVSLFNKLNRALSNVYRLTQRRTKDIEELLRTDGSDGPLTLKLRGLLEDPISYNVALTAGRI